MILGDDEIEEQEQEVGDADNGEEEEGVVMITLGQYAYPNCKWNSFCIDYGLIINYGWLYMTVYHLLGDKWTIPWFDCNCILFWGS